jgi:hypothetical protein
MATAGVLHSIKVVELESAILIPDVRRILRVAPAEGAPGQHLARGALLDRASEIVGDAQHAELNRRRIRHRALADAEGMRWWWLEVRTRVDEACGAGFRARLLASKGSVPKGVLR